MFHLYYNEEVSKVLPKSASFGAVMTRGSGGQWHHSSPQAVAVVTNA